ncbi:Aldo/keto reductase [Cantharellus anzutake]|uniref:Aldo/keto reductase n=1 Tax=Cantharellus anzutake TaxID=1750568 RepID=UPI00190853D3|nr:Aldo/keto reductase [Cantharellus anzutake]KAF8327168.1 Aldo/keto reductase [Cantharellus anzutake]
MPFSTLPLNDGTKVPQLAVGTGTALFRRDAEEAVLLALNNGIYHIDAAQVYGNEESVGRALAKAKIPREKLYITTKVETGPPLDGLKESLRKLRLNYVDLYLIHHPSNIPDVVGAWKELEEAKRLGLTKSIGVSNATVSHLQVIAASSTTVPAVNQIEFHPYNLAYEAPVVAYAATHNIVIEAYCSLYPITRRPNGPVTKALEGPSERLKATPTQVLFQWVKAKDAVIVTTTSKQERIEEYLAAGDLPALTQEEIEVIDNAGLSDPSRR